MRETYNLNGPKDFYFPHPVRYPAQITVEVIPGGVLPSSQYQVIGYGPTATGVTVRYPSAPTDGTQELAISRQTEPERVSEFEDDVGATAAALNAEFDNIYQVLQDLNLEDWRGDWAASTTYEINSVIYGPDGNIYRATQPHTSSSSFSADLNAGLWSLIVNFALGQQQVDDSVDLAERWASEDEDVEVEGGKFSSRHYSAKASSSALDAASSASAAAASEENAAASASSASISEAQIEQWRDDTLGYKNSAENTISEFESGYTGFSDNHGYDFGSVTTAVTYFNRDFGGLS